MAYSEKVVDHYEKPRNVGSLDKKSKEVGTGIVGAPIAIGNAVLDALRSLGVRRLDLPYTSERVWRAICTAAQETRPAEGE